MAIWQTLKQIGLLEAQTNNRGLWRLIFKTHVIYCGENYQLVAAFLSAWSVNRRR